MKIAHAVLMSATTFLTSVACAATEETAQQLYAACSDSSPIAQMYCQKYIFGIAQGFELGAAMMTDGKYSCIPETATQSQLTLIVKKRLDDEPQYLHLPADVIVIKALVQAFGCRDPMAFSHSN